MVVVPPMRRGENSLLLWNLNNPSVPVHTFVGHTDVILEFEWRKTLKESELFLFIASLNGDNFFTPKENKMTQGMLQLHIKN